MGIHGKVRHGKGWNRSKPAIVAYSAAVVVAGGIGVAAFIGTVGSAGAATGTIYGCLNASKTIVNVGPTPPNCTKAQQSISWIGLIGSTTPPSPSPSPIPTTPTPTPDPTTSTTPPTTTACVTSADNGLCGPYADQIDINASNGSNTYVGNDVWNPISGASQTLTSNGPHSWSVSANMPAGNTAVVSYPNTQQLYTTTSDTPDPLTSFTQITSSYTTTGFGQPGDYEAAYDIFLGTGACDANCYNREIMVWTDNHGQTPAGTEVSANVTIGTASYQLWVTAKSASTADSVVTLVQNSQGAAGAVDILAALNYLVTNGYEPTGAGLNSIQMGWEICSTNGSAETFGLSAYGLTTVGG